MIAGGKEDFIQARPFFEASAADSGRDEEEIAEACCVAARAARLAEDAVSFFKYSSKVLAQEANSEICCELGAFYEERQDYAEAAIWYYNAVYETQPVLNIHAGGREPLEGLVRCYQQMGEEKQAEIYRRELNKL